MPRGVRKAINYDEELRKIDERIGLLTEKRKEILEKKANADMRALTEFITNNNMTVADAIAILSPAVAAAAQAKPTEA